MIELTPLEDTVAGKELIQQGMEILKRPQTPNVSLAALAIEELEPILEKLEVELSHEPNSELIARFRSIAKDARSRPKPVDIISTLPLK